MSAVLNKGDIFSGCRILAECGKGAYGVVYLAENAIGQKIVIKLVTSSGHSDREFRGLKHYIPVSGTHPNLLQVFHVGKFADGFYYTMEAADNLNDSGDFYRPATLGNMLREGRKFSPEYAVRVTRELLGGVSAMHRANLVHRDIKPDNIIFVNGKAKLSDPGLVTEAGQPETFAGTPGFIPPECIADALPATRAMIFMLWVKSFTAWSPAILRESTPICRKICASKCGGSFFHRSLRCATPIPPSVSLPQKSF